MKLIVGQKEIRKCSCPAHSVLQLLMEYKEQTAIFLFPESQEASEVDLRREMLDERTQICSFVPLAGGRLRRGVHEPFVYKNVHLHVFLLHMLQPHEPLTAS